MRPLRLSRRFASTLCLPLLLGALFLPGSSLSAQTSIPIPRAAAGDTVTLRLAIGTDTVRVIERDTVLVRDTLVVIDTVTVFQHDTVLVVDTLIVRDTLRVVERDTVVVRDTVWVERPAEPDPVEPAPADSIVAWSPIVEPSARYDTLAVGDTVRLTVVGATVSAITPLGTRITRAATMDELRAAGFYWVHSGMGQRLNESADGLSVTFKSTGLYGSRITHLTLMSREARNMWRLVVLNVEADAPPQQQEPEPQEPDPVEEPDEPPVVCLDYPCDGYESIEVGDSLAAALEFDGQTVHQAGISYDRYPQPSYPCARVLSGIAAAVVGDTIRVTQVQGGERDVQRSPVRLRVIGDTIRAVQVPAAGDVEVSERLWCIPYNWAAITEGDDTRARTYPAQPHGERAWYGDPGEPLPSRGSGADGVRGF